MSKKYDNDDSLKQLVEEQFIKEAEIMEKALFSDENFEDYEMTDQEVEDSYQDFCRRLEETEEKILPKTEKMVPLSRKLKRRIPVAKVAGIAVLCVISIFAASMTGEANRRYVINSVRYLMGDDTRIVVDNDEENELPETDEYEAIADIEATLGVEVPEFMYRPEGMLFRKYNIDENSGTAWLEYDYKESVLILYLDQEIQKTSSKIDSLDGKGQEKILIFKNNIEATISEIESENIDGNSYSAKWKWKDVIYQFSGRISKDIFYKIIEKAIY